MYPETDLKEISIDKKNLLRLEKNLPLWPEQRKEQYIKKFGLSAQLAEKMKLDNNAIFFEQLAVKGADATTTAWLLLEGLIQLRRNGILVEKISDSMIENSLFSLKKGEISKDILLQVLGVWSKQPEKKLSEIIVEMGISKISEEEVRTAIKGIVEKNKAIVLEKKLGAISALMGDAMRELKGKASGETISRILKEEILKAK